MKKRIYANFKTDSKCEKKYSSEVASSMHQSEIYNIPTSYYAGADPEILKSGGALCRPPWSANEENFRFQMV